MEKKNTHIVRRILTRIVPLVLLAYLLLFTGFYVAGIRSTLNTWNSVAEGSEDTLRYAEEEWDLMHHNALLEARLKMAGSDSIGMTVNLADSLVQLEMDGVVLRTIRPEKVEAARFFKGIDPVAYVHHFSKPFVITEIEGSIEKNPITTKKAPKDTLEAAQNEPTLDSVRAEWVEWHLLLDSTLIISIVQSDQFDGGPSLKTWKYRMKRHAKTLGMTNNAMLRLKKPKILPEITVYIPAAEARSFFRALPREGNVIVRL